MITKKEFKICLSCPNELVRERQICEAAISEYTQFITSEEIQYTVVHSGTVASQFGKSPQEIINEEWDGFDLYIGLMGTRFGTPTEKYESGTEEEFNVALEKHKKDSSVSVSFLFQNVSTPLSELSEKQLEQYMSVLSFKSGISSLGIFCRSKSAQTALSSHGLFWKSLHRIKFERLCLFP
ncbi:MAG: DUF4062 domain-containing protein [Alphaproteobacteria bacterium]|nr:DUF4062 domain-containing protein [Alphaproteobacteria bacterium]